MKSLERGYTARRVSFKSFDETCSRSHAFQSTFPSQPVERKCEPTRKTQCKGEDEEKRKSCCRFTSGEIFLFHTLTHNTHGHAGSRKWHRRIVGGTRRSLDSVIPCHRHSEGKRDTTTKYHLAKQNGSRRRRRRRRSRRRRRMAVNW